ncbi:MAG TPA: DUF3604 domain-containing protein [Verrucomicrobiae bacterium]|nr:DUF3604 domain-containing protein [Verrucomicrobiae bacterium]
MKQNRLFVTIATWTFAAFSVVAAPNPERNAYFGETHVHTSWSFDAYIFGNHLTGPAQAYEYAQGKPIPHPMGYKIKIDQPLDWMGVTDHSEYVGTIAMANQPGTAISKLPIAEKLKVHNLADVQRIYLWLGYTMIDMKPVKELVSPEVAGTVWKETVAIADRYYQPGKFTTFASYEWTSTPNNCNMHRNIFFRDSKKVCDMPFSSLDSQTPEDLWNWMDKQRAAGNELLAISHNANLSDGLMYPTEVDFSGRPIDKAWAEARMRNEALTEIKQIKGQSETHPLLSPNDEFASFEVLNYLLGDPKGRAPHVSGSYIREALQHGIAMEATRGYNPYKFGFVGGSDSHNTAVPYRQDNFFGAHGLNDGGLKERMSGHIFAGLDTRLENPAGLSGVWAEENTREAIFDAMKRKETFATSGPRIQIRFFGSWGGLGYDELKLTGRWEKTKDWVKIGYRDGVPMGGDLPAPKSKSPKFIVWALKDPTSGNLDRIQIVKGWTRNGQIFEKVYDVVWAGDRKIDPSTGKLEPIKNTVNVTAASYKNSVGAVELKKVWEDPDFDPSLDAFYYARALEIHTPRWTTIQAKQLGIVPPTEGTSMGVPQPIALTVQERAWSSPIWYTPTAEARAKAPKGLTVAELKQQGGTPLDDAALKQLIVGNVVKVRDTVTGRVYDILYGAGGRRMITSVDGRQPAPGDPFHVDDANSLGAPAHYEIKDGKIVTMLGNVPFDVSVYKLGDKYVAARASEFGYANYAVLSITPPSAIESRIGGDVKAP